MCGGEEQTHTADNKSGGMSVYVRVIVQTLEFVMLPDAVLASTNNYYELSSLAGFKVVGWDSTAVIFFYFIASLMGLDWDKNVSLDLWLVSKMLGINILLH